ncbi:TRAP transporter substrate-binding protein [Marinovum sp. 2_MG-2023]|uniref:TRAP transporter substrate-binding protein n=1 Tax=unclassified Marinovum TaxID=2647166 RepID=UPI0026E1730A|nr:MULTISPECIES: TRAP transporter substrate-binding protein [unclassified Marinovum]MDO6732382.1 TRAP transporter substrate-binding protein [Marinovum sp. 2_MG-2023]MDO6781699.1 TRAP transporter substrate-binding protein [Marinovum sp. 1_MG-2023]
MTKTLSALAVLLLGSTSVMAADYELKLGHAAIGAENPVHLALEAFAEDIAESTDGQIEVTIFGGGQMGNDRELVELAQEGTIDIAVPTVSKLSAWDPAFAAPEIPYVFPNRDVALSVLGGAYGDFLEPKLNDLGLTTVGWFENGFRHVTNNLHPISKPEDLQGIKLRTMAVEAHIEAFGHLGANPTPMAFSELYSALQQNVVDGQENPLTNIVNNKMYEVQDYVSLTNHVYSAYIVVMNQGAYEDMPEELQTQLREALARALQTELDIIDADEARNLDVIEEAGVKVNALSDAEVAVFRETLGALSGRFEELVGADAYQALTAAVSETQ